MRDIFVGDILNSLKIESDFNIDNYVFGKMGFDEVGKIFRLE